MKIKTSKLKALVHKMNKTYPSSETTEGYNLAKNDFLRLINLYEVEAKKYILLSLWQSIEHKEERQK